MQDLTQYHGICRNRLVRCLLGALGARSEEEMNHGSRVAVYAVAIGQELGWDQANLLQLRDAGALHDIGKLEWPPGMFRMGPVATSRTRSHPLKGVELLAGTGQFEPILPWILDHHERWDGTGYPRGLKGESIPMGARIVAVAEVFDCLTMSCGWRDPLGEDEALAIVGEQSGLAFDPGVVDAFQKIRLVIQPLGL